MENVSVLVAIGVSREDRRETIGVADGMKEDLTSGERFVKGVIERGLRSVRFMVGDGCTVLVSTVVSMLQQSKY